MPEPSTVPEAADAVESAVLAVLRSGRGADLMMVDVALDIRDLVLFVTMNGKKDDGEVFKAKGPLRKLGQALAAKIDSVNPPGKAARNAKGNPRLALRQTERVDQQRGIRQRFEQRREFAQADKLDLSIRWRRDIAAADFQGCP